MVTLVIIGVVALVSIITVIVLLSVAGVIFTGVAAVLLDVLIGLSPFILVWVIWKKFFRKGDDDG